MLSAALVARIFFVCHVNAEGSIHRSEQTDKANDMIGARHCVLVVADVLHAVEAWTVEEAFACFGSTLMARSPEQNGSTRARSRRVESMFPFVYPKRTGGATGSDDQIPHRATASRYCRGCSH